MGQTGTTLLAMALGTIKFEQMPPVDPVCKQTWPPAAFNVPFLLLDYLRPPPSCFAHRLAPQIDPR